MAAWRGTSSGRSGCTTRPGSASTWSTSVSPTGRGSIITPFACPARRPASWSSTAPGPTCCSSGGTGSSRARGGGGPGRADRGGGGPGRRRRPRGARGDGLAARPAPTAGRLLSGRRRVGPALLHLGGRRRPPRGAAGRSQRGGPVASGIPLACHPGSCARHRADRRAVAAHGPPQPTWRCARSPADQRPGRRSGDPGADQAVEGRGGAGPGVSRRSSTRARTSPGSPAEAAAASRVRSIPLRRARAWLPPSIEAPGARRRGSPSPRRSPRRRRRRRPRSRAARRRSTAPGVGAGRRLEAGEQAPASVVSAGEAQHHGGVPVVEDRRSRSRRGVWSRRPGPPPGP